MNSRKIILKMVKGLPKTEMITWCLFGKRYQDQLVDALYGTENIYVYHQKGERVFQKNYPLNEIEGSILEIALDYNEPLKLKKEDFVYQLIDPFYKKPMNELSFLEMIALPIHHEDKTIGVVLIYGDGELPLNDFSENEFKEIIQEIMVEEEKEALLTFTCDFLKELQLPYIIKNGDQIKYLSSAAKKLGNDKLSENYQKDVKLINDFEVEIYHEFKKERSKSIHIINELSEENTSSLIVVTQKQKNRRFEDFFEKLQRDIKDVFPKTANFYKYDDQTIVVGFSEIINKHSYNQFKNSYQEYSVNFVRVTKEIPTKQNLVKVASYLVEHISETFDYQNYLNYRKMQEEESYYESLILTSKAKLVFHPIENSKHGNVLGYFPSFIFQNLELFGHRILNFDLSLTYNKKLFTTLLKTKTWPGLIMITLLGKQLLNDEIMDLVLKLSQKEQFKIAIHLAKVGDIHRESLLKSIKKLKKKEHLLYASDDLFASLNLFELMDYFDGIVIDNPLFKRVKAGDYDLITMVINYYLQRHKLVIFRELTSEDKIMISPHQNVYWKK